MNFPAKEKAAFGGLLPAFVHFTPKEWNVKAIYNRCGTMITEPDSNISNYFLGFSLNESSRLVEDETPSPAGKIYKYKFTGKYTDSAAMQKVLAYMTSRHHYIIVQDRNNKARLLGKPQALAEFTWSYDTETEGANDPLLTYKIEWENNRPAPEINFIDLCNPTMPVDNPQGIGYWFIDQDFIVQ